MGESKPDGETGLLRSQTSALEADSSRFRRHRPGLFFAGDLFHLQRLAQPASSRPFLAYGKAAIPRSERKRKGKSARETPPGYSGSRRTPPPTPQSSFPTHAELPARGPGRLLRFMGYGQLLFLARVCAADRPALPNMVAGSQPRRPSASREYGNEHDVRCGQRANSPSGGRQSNAVFEDGRHQHGSVSGGAEL